MKLNRTVANFSVAEPEAVVSTEIFPASRSPWIIGWGRALSRACHVDDERSFSGIVRSFQ
jgi:hypothetical protein